MSTAPFSVDLLSSPTSSTSFSASPDYAALVVILLVVALTAFTLILTLYRFIRTPWVPPPPSTSPPPYKLRALQEGLQLLDFPTHLPLPSVLRTTDGIQPLSDPHPPPVLPSDPITRRHSLPSPPPPSPPPTLPDPLQPLLLTSPTPPLTDGTSDIYQHELSSNPHNQSLEGFDLSSATSILQDSKASLTTYLTSQSAAFTAFYHSTHHHLDHIRQLLAVKLSVTLNTHQHGFLDSIDRLVSGEVLARQAAKDMHRRMEEGLSREVEELVTSLRNLSDSYEVYPIVHLLRAIAQHVDRIDLHWRTERSRRKHLAAFIPIVGRRVVEALAALDVAEEPLVDAHLAAVLFFQAASTEIRQRLTVEEANHAGLMEKLDESNLTRRDYEMDRYHLQLMKVMRDLQTQLTYLDEKTKPLYPQMRRGEDEAKLVWALVQGPLLEERWAEVEGEGKGAGGLWRGINAELAKVLSGLLGMQGGVEWEEGKWRSKRGFDPLDPFSTVFDPGFAQDKGKEGKEEKEGKEQLGDGERGKKKGKDKKREDSSRSGQSTVEQTSAQRDSEDESKQQQQEVIAAPIPSPGVQTTQAVPKDAGSDQATAVSPAPADSPASGVPPAALLAPFTSAHSPAMADTLHQRAAIQADRSLSAAERSAALQALDADVAALLQGWAGEVIEVVSAWKAAREADDHRGNLDDVHDQHRQSADALGVVREELRQVRERQAKERQALEEEAREKREEEERYMVDPTCVAELMAKAREVAGEVEDEEVKEVRLLMEQGITDPALLAVTLIEQREQRREAQLRAVTLRHEAELAVLVQREAEAAEVEEREAELKRRLVQVRAHEAMVIKLEQDTEEEWDVQPEVVSMEVPCSEGRLVRILRVDQHRVAALCEKQAEATHQHEAERVREMEELNARQGALAELSDDEWTERVAAMEAEHARQQAEEERAHQAQAQLLTHELSGRCVQQQREHGESLKEQRRKAMEETEAIEAAAIAEWETHKGGRALGPLVAGLLRRRQQRQLELLMDAMARDRLTALSRALSQRTADAEPVDLPSLQRSIRSEAAADEFVALEQLQSQHRAQLDAALLRCGGRSETDGVPVELSYAEVAARATSIAEAMEKAQAAAAGELAEKQRRILSDQSMTEEEKAAAMRSLLDGLHRFDEKVAGEAARQEEEMRRRMEEKRRKKMAAEEQKAQAEHAAKDDLAQAAIRAQQQQQQTILPSPSASVPTTAEPTPATSPSTLAAQDADAQAQLSRIEQLVVSLHSDALTWQKTAYTDEADSTDARLIAEEGAGLALVPLTSLTPSQAYLHRFALSLLHLFHSLHSIPHPTHGSSAPPTLLLASSLPAPSHPCCAYRHVLSYDEALHALCVRVERMEEVGRFIAVVVHGTAHVMAEWEVRAEVRKRAWKARKRSARAEDREEEKGEKDGVEAEEEERLRWEREERKEVDRSGDDRDPRFLRHLHRLQSTLMADLFFASSNQPSASALLPPLPASALEEELRDEGRVTATLAAAASSSAVTALLIQLSPAGQALPVSPSDLCSHLPHFSASRVLARLSRYSAFSQHSALMTYLADLERAMHQRQVQDRVELQERLGRVDPALVRSGSARWKVQEEEEERGGVEWVDQAEDELNGRLGEVVEQWWRVKGEIEAGERAMGEVDVEDDTALGKQARDSRQQRADELREKRWRLACLVEEKDNIMAQLRQCQQARASAASAASPIAVD